jgi:hypothetical protein
MGSLLFARGNIIEKKLGAFARLDVYNSDIDKKESGNIELFTVFVIDYKPIKQINISPNIWINTYKSKDKDAGNRKPDVIARVTFRFKL